MSVWYTDEKFEFSGFEEILGPNTIRKLPIQTRLEICNTDFTIVENKDGEQSLFCALAQALVGSQSESHINEIHAVVSQYILVESWDRYKDIIESTTSPAVEVDNDDAGTGTKPTTSKSKSSTTPDPSKSKTDYRETYTNFSYSSLNKGSMIELCAAAEKFHFTFGVMILTEDPDKVLDHPDPNNAGPEHYDDPAEFTMHVYNCESESITDNSCGVKYYFLQSGDRKEDWEWNYLEPIGELSDIPDGVYECSFKRLVQYPKQLHHYHFHGNYMKRIPSYGPTPSNLIQKVAESCPITMMHDGREFFHKKTPYDDQTLFGLLNHTLFDSQTEMKDRIQLIIADKRLEIGHVVEPTSERNRIMSRKTLKNLHLSNYRYGRCGDVIDLRIAAAIFAFTYEVFGLDDNMNWFRIVNEHVPAAKSEVFKTKPNAHLILFLKSKELGFQLKWYRLEQELPTSMWNSLKSAAKKLFVESSTGTDNGDWTSTSAGDSDFTGTGTETETEAETGTGTGTETETGAETETESIGDRNNFTSDSDSDEARRRIGPKKSVFKSIPIMPAHLEKRDNSVWGYLKSWFEFLSPSTRVLLIPKNLLTNSSNEKTRETYEINYKLAKILSGNIPWFVSLPDSDYYLVTLNKSNPSTCLPFAAFYTAHGNHMEARIWGSGSESDDNDADFADEKTQSVDDKFMLRTPNSDSYLNRVLRYSRSAFRGLRNALGSRIHALLFRNNKVGPDNQKTLKDPLV